MQDSIPPLASVKEGVRLDIQKNLAEKARVEELAEMLKKEVALVKDEVSKVSGCCGRCCHAQARALRSSRREAAGCGVSFARSASPAERDGVAGHPGTADGQ